MSDMRSTVREQIVEHIGQEHSAGMSNARTLDHQTRLIEEDIIDSLGIFVLVEFLERRFGIIIDPEEMVLENFETVDAIARMVEQKL